MSNIVNPDLLLDVGDEVPGFTLDSNVGNIMFREIIYGRWCLLITFDQAFEPAATTDLGMVGKLKEEFDDELFCFGSTQYRLPYALKSCQVSGNNACNCVNNSTGRDKAGVPDNNITRRARCKIGKIALVRFACRVFR